MAEKWKFDKKISIGHVLALIVIATPGFIWASNAETRITVLESAKISAENLASERQKSLEKWLERIEKKIK